MKINFLLSVGMACGFGLICTHTNSAAEDKPGLELLFHFLSESKDPSAQHDILKGINAALSGQRGLKPPEKWNGVYEKLNQSSRPEIQREIETLAVIFGDRRVFGSLRRTLADPSADWQRRTNALKTLLQARDPDLPVTLHSLLGEQGLRNESIKALAAFDHPGTPGILLKHYPDLTMTEKATALYTLASRPVYALHLRWAVEKESIPKGDLSAATLRQLRNLKQPELDAWILSTWGRVAPSNEKKEAEIASLKKTLKDAYLKSANLSKGHTLYLRSCAPCHTLFGEGGKVGPEITGGNRSDLDYLLQNIVDPSAVVSKEYQASTVETKEGRVITGLVTKTEGNSITLMTDKETITFPRSDVLSITQGELSMMPDGLLDPLASDEVRDLIAYLQSKGPTTPRP